MKDKTHYKTIEKTCLIANIAYIILRVFYLVLFIVSKLYVLMWIDIASIVFYFGCFYLVKKHKYLLYALLCGNEYLAFIIAATFLIGFNTGFHFYLIGLTVVSFFTSYFSKNKNMKGSIFWAGLSLAIYLMLYIVSSYRIPNYQIDKWLEMTLFTTHAILVFVFIVFYLVIFVKYTLTLENRIMNESRTDELTQISNRYGLYDYFAQEENKFDKVLALFDIDNFKLINDNYGHVTGDFILKRVAEIASSILGESYVFRYGGEEFVTVIDKEDAPNKLEELRKAIEDESFAFQGTKHKITITIGVANYNKDIALEKWVDLADEKMYTGKRSGKNQVVM